MQYVAYLRVSTREQGQDGLGIEAQRFAVASYDPVAEFVEVESGNKTNRPQLAAAMAHAKRIKATLVIAKLDRLARNVAFVAKLMDSGVEFVCVDNPHATRLTLHILAAVAEDEARRIAERTKAALAALQARGVRLGCKATAEGYAKYLAKTKLSLARQKAGADAFAASVMPAITKLRSQGVTTYDGIARCLNGQGVKSARGGLWYPMSVSNVIVRA